MKLTLLNDHPSFGLQIKSKLGGETYLNINPNTFYYDDKIDQTYKIWPVNKHVEINESHKGGCDMNIYGKNNAYDFYFTICTNLFYVDIDGIHIDPMVTRELKNPSFVTIKSSDEMITSDIAFEDLKESLAETAELIVKKLNENLVAIIKIEE